MFNVTIVKMKDITRYAVGLMILMIIILFITQNFGKIKNESEQVKKEVENKFETISEDNLLSCLNQTIPVVANINKEYNGMMQEEKLEKEKDFLKEVLKAQISSIKGIDNIDNSKVEDTKEVENNKEKVQDVEMAKTGLPTEVITQNPLKESFNAQYNKVKIKNETDYTLTDEMMNPDITIENKNVVLFHTHSCESYTSSEKYPYEPTGTFRTTDLNYTVTRVGTELETRIKAIWI